MYRWCTALVTSILLTACASSPGQGGSGMTNTAQLAPSAGTSVAQVSAETKPKLVCIEDQPLGSHIPKKICITPEQAAARQKASRDVMDKMNSAPSAPFNPSAGGPPSR